MLGELSQTALQCGLLITATGLSIIPLDFDSHYPLQIKIGLTVRIHAVKPFSLIRKFQPIDLVCQSINHLCQRFEHKRQRRNPPLSSQFFAQQISRSRRKFPRGGIICRAKMFLTVS